MATLHKFKLLATQCAIASSPSRSPTMSPVIHLRRRRRKTLRMLLNRSDRRRSPGNQDMQDDDDLDDPPVDKIEKEVRVRRKLKDLFVSSPPLDDKLSDKRREEQERLLPAAGNPSSNITGSITHRSLRPVSATFRQRLLRSAWRPVLVSIPE